MSGSFHLAHANTARSRFELMWKHGPSAKAFTPTDRFEVSA
jgi:hypothetical protein